MFGFHCPENFRYPYMARSVSEFWRRWHITLGAWFRDYVYIPLGGSRVNSKMRLYANLLAVWLLTGLWHGASWNFIIWGVAHFVLIAFEKTTGLPEKLNGKSQKILYRIFFLLFIIFQWVIFNADGFRAGMDYIYHMFFAAENPLADTRTLFLIKDNLIFIMTAVILCFPVVPWMEKRWQNKKALRFLWNAASLLLPVLLFLLAVSFVVAGQNNPFAYANF